MDKDKRRKLETKGFRVGSVAEFLELGQPDSIL